MLRTSTLGHSFHLSPGSLKNGLSKPRKIRLPLLILQKDLEKSSHRVGSDAVITQDILENKSEKPVRTTSENTESELADHYHITRTYSPPAYLADCILHYNNNMKHHMSAQLQKPAAGLAGSCSCAGWGTAGRLSPSSPSPSSSSSSEPLSRTVARSMGRMLHLPRKTFQS